MFVSKTQIDEDRGATMTTKEINPLCLAQVICQRPKLFTANGSLGEVVALLEGYELALRNSEKLPKDRSPSHVLSWLAREVGYSEIQTTPEIRVQLIEAHFQTEDKAFEAIGNYLENQSPK